MWSPYLIIFFDRPAHPKGTKLNSVWMINNWPDWKGINNRGHSRRDHTWESSKWKETMAEFFCALNKMLYITQCLKTPASQRASLPTGMALFYFCIYETTFCIVIFLWLPFKKSTGLFLYPIVLFYWIWKLLDSFHFSFMQESTELICSGIQREVILKCASPLVPIVRRHHCLRSRANSISFFIL